MEDINTSGQISALLSKAITGALTEEEACRLKTWREESEGHTSLYEEVMCPGFVKKKCEEMKRVDLVYGYMKIVEKRRRNARVRRMRRILSAAAGILLPIIAVLFWLGEKDGQVQTLELTSVTIKPGEIRAELVLADGTTRLLDATVTDSLLYQQGANISIKDKRLNYNGDTARTSVQYNTLRVPRGGEYSVTLSDGTVVYLNSESELYYPVKFAGEERRVRLSGEAYFEVKPDKQHPFIVDLQTSSVRVLGTSFDVRAYRDEDRVMTTLVEGAVAFSSGEKKVVLAPGEQGVLDQSGVLKKKSVDTYTYTAWKEGVFAFKQERLEEIMRIVARWYNVNVFWTDASQKEVTFTGKMRRYDDFSKIVEMLQMTGNTGFEIKDNAIYISER